MPNINKNIIMQAGAAVANATNKAAGLSASTPEPGSIISAIQLVNGGRTIGPAALAHFTESVRNKLLSLLVSMEPIQSGSGTPSPNNVRPINGRTGLTVYVGPTQDQQDATTYAVDWTTEAGTVYGGTLDVVTGVLTVTHVSMTPTIDWLQSINSYGIANFGFGFPTGYEANNAQAAKESVISNLLPAQSSSIASTQEQGILIANSTGGYLRLDSSVASTIEQANTWIAENGFMLVYELATPLTYQLTGQDIITLVGDNYIWSDSGDVTITE